MKVIIAHNFYRLSVPSGENIAVERETALLKQAGIDCFSFSKSNDELDRADFFKKLRVAWNMTGSSAQRLKLKKELREFGGPGILHAHNLLPMFSYDLFEVAKDLGYQTVHSLHNYQLIASKPQSGLEDKDLNCLNAQSRGFLELFYKRACRKFWRENKLRFIDKFICLTEFQKQLMIKAGLPSERLFVKPNFLPDPHTYQEDAAAGDYAIFVGRLSEEKGIVALTQAWQKLSIPLYVIGSGPLAGRLPKTPHIHYLGAKPQHEAIALIAKARFLVMNSTWYEPFGLVAIEALSCGVPCLVPRIAALPEFIEAGKTGDVFEPGNEKEMLEKAIKLWDGAANMKKQCRAEYLSKYTPQVNLARLLQIYRG